MDHKRHLGPISPLRVFGFGGGAGFLLDIVGHTIDLYWRGIPVSFTNIYQYGARTGHAEAWLASCIMFGLYSAYVLRQAVGAVLGSTK